MHDYIHSSISFSICFPHTRHTRLYMTCLSFHLQIDRTLLSRIRIVFLKSVIWIRSCSVVQWWTSSRRPWRRAAQRRQQPERGDPIFQRRGQEGHWPGFSYRMTAMRWCSQAYLQVASILVRERSCRNERMDCCSGLRNSIVNIPLGKRSFDVYKTSFSGNTIGNHVGVVHERLGIAPTSRRGEKVLMGENCAWQTKK